MNWVDLGTVVALILSALAGTGTVLAQRKVTDSAATETITDAAAKAVKMQSASILRLEKRMSVMEEDAAACRKENHLLWQWSAVLIEHLVKADVKPMTYDEFKQKNGHS
jgi:hypothetical protein